MSQCDLVKGNHNSLNNDCNYGQLDWIGTEKKMAWEKETLPAKSVRPAWKWTSGLAHFNRLSLWCCLYWVECMWYAGELHKSVCVCVTTPYTHTHTDRHRRIDNTNGEMDRPAFHGCWVNFERRICVTPSLFQLCGVSMTVNTEIVNKYISTIVCVFCWWKPRLDIERGRSDDTFIPNQQQQQQQQQPSK